MIKQAKCAAAALAVAALSGCAVGLSPGGASLAGDFEAPVAYGQAYQSAVDQAKLCLLGSGAYHVEGGLDAASHKGTMRVVANLVDSREMARVEVSPAGENRTKVHVQMWGRSIWDAKAMVAMHDAVYFSSPSCSVYIPPQQGVDPTAWFHVKK
ncbi:MAG: BPTD_2524 family lipoprotein [Bordetella sp.]|uniref:BPTD_2524 family lipoprotein n=1 Tax=Bordetella sp. TaxID=28081 RepID=UPI003F7BDADB